MRAWVGVAVNARVGFAGEGIKDGVAQRGELRHGAGQVTSTGVGDS